MPQTRSEGNTLRKSVCKGRALSIAVNRCPRRRHTYPVRDPVGDGVCVLLGVALGDSDLLGVGDGLPK